MAAAIVPVVLPDRFARSGIDREHVVGNGEVQDAVHHQRRRLDRRLAHAALGADPRDAVHPSDRERIDVRGVDLRQTAIAPPGIIAVIGRPDVGRLREQRERLRIEALAGQPRRQRGKRRDDDDSCQLHFSVTRYAVTLCTSASVYLPSNSR